MRKKYALEDLDCASCASKIEVAVSKLEGVTFSSVDFMRQEMTIEAEEGKFKEVEKSAKKIVSRNGASFA